MKREGRGGENDLTHPIAKFLAMPLTSAATTTCYHSNYV